MIAKIHQGKGFGGLVGYANDILKKDTVIIAAEGVSLTSNATITASFKAQAKARPNVKLCVGHISLSFSPEDFHKLTSQQIEEIAREYMRRMGIVNTQFVIFRHQDQPHPHVHIVYNRVDNDGNTITGDSNYSKSAAITKALTRQYGLSFGKGKKNVRRERLKGKDAIKYHLYDIIIAALKDSITWQQLRKALSAKGISLDFVRNSDGSVRGVTFTDNAHHVTFSGSKIDRSLSFGSIDKNMVNIYQINGDPNDRPEFYPHYDTEYITHVTQQYGEYGQDRHASSSNGIEETFTYTPSSGKDGGTSSGSGIGAAIAEVLLQPHVIPSFCGGGSSSSKDDDDDDKEKDKNKYYIPRKRKR
ncbi:MAG: relaxase/mobilization nuclease domain-containing protein [Prevotella sp.]|nr:relaxase/mobilization nuclease domain-containing protein [Prevotella sp.]